MFASSGLIMTISSEILAKGRLDTFKS